MFPGTHNCDKKIRWLYLGGGNTPSSAQGMLLASWRGSGDQLWWWRLNPAPSHVRQAPTLSLGYHSGCSGVYFSVQVGVPLTALPTSVQAQVPFATPGGSDSRMRNE